MPRRIRLTLLLLLWAGSVWAQTYTINTLADNTSTDGQCTLREAITAINGVPSLDCPAGGGGPEIVFSVVGTITLNGTSLLILGDVTLTGGGVITVDGDLQSRVFDIVLTAEVTMQDFAITGGKAPNGKSNSDGTPAEDGGDGGGIRNAGSLTLLNMDIFGNVAGRGGNAVDAPIGGGDGGNGGGLSNTGTLTMDNTLLRLNTAGSGGSGDPIHPGKAGDGGGLWNAGMATLTQVSVTDNITGAGGFSPFHGNSGGNGGGIFNEGTLTLDQTTLANNETRDATFLGAGGHGGGLYTAGPATLTDCIIDANESGNGGSDGSSGGAGGSGAGIYTTGAGQLNILRTTISNNTTGNLACGADPNGCGNPGRGGGLYGSNVTLTNVTISNNQTGKPTPDVGEGGGLYVNGVAQINNSTIAENNAGTSIFTRDARGGGIFATAVAAVTLYSTLVAGNSSTEGPDLFGDFQTDGFNLIGDAADFTGLTDGFNNDQVGVPDAGLEPLADNGGDSSTHALTPTSPAIDAGDCSLSAISTDQRGNFRPFDQPHIDNAGDGCDVGAFEVQGFGLALGLRLMLHGPYLEGVSAIGRMSNDLFPAGLLPATQPYSDPLFDGTALDYDGTETPTGFVTSETDWVLVELRTGTGPETTVARQAALLRFGGSVYNMAGEGTLYFPGLAPGDYYLVVRHRNHLPVMTATPLALSDTRVFQSFVDAMGSAFGTNPMIEVEPGIHALWSGDGNADGSITSFDFLNVWLPANGSAGYLQADFNLSGDVTAFDFLQHWLVANGQQSQVPE